MKLWLFRRVCCFIQAVLGVLSNLISVLTLGLYWPNFDYRFMFWNSICMIEQRMREEEEKK